MSQLVPAVLHIDQYGTSLVNPLTYEPIKYDVNEVLSEKVGGQKGRYLVNVKVTIECEVIDQYTTEPETTIQYPALVA